MISPSPPAVLAQVRTYRIHLFRGPEAEYVVRDKGSADLTFVIDKAVSMARDDALWSISAVFASPAGDVEHWVMGTDYRTEPTTWLQSQARYVMQWHYLMSARQRLAAEVRARNPPTGFAVSRFVAAGDAVPEAPAAPTIPEPTLPDGRRVIRMFDDYGSRDPLWGVRPRELGLSEALIEALEAWTRLDMWIDQGPGGPRPVSYAVVVAEGLRLRLRVLEQLAASGQHWEIHPHFLMGSPQYADVPFAELMRASGSDGLWIGDQSPGKGS